MPVYRRLREHLVYPGFMLSLPESLAERFLALPGIGIWIACQAGETVGTSWDRLIPCPHIDFTLPRDADVEDAYNVFGDFAIVGHLGHGYLRRETVLLRPKQIPPTPEEELRWWEMVLAGLEAMALPEHPKIGPFNVHFYWRAEPDPSVIESESFGFLVFDRVSGYAVGLQFDIVGGELLDVKVDCHLHPHLVDWQFAEAKKKVPSWSREIRENLNLDEVVDMIMQTAQGLSGFSWSREEVSEDLAFAMTACVKYKGVA